MNDTSSFSHTGWNCKYHIVFGPKDRRKGGYSEKRVEVGKYGEICMNGKGYGSWKRKRARLTYTYSRRSHQNIWYRVSGEFLRS